jgi:hypothetical protein
MTWARQAISEGKGDKALWNVDMALSLSPRMEEAIRLKERLSGQAFWSDYAQDSSAHYIIQRMLMQDLNKPVERMIPPGKPREASKVEPVVRDAFGIEQRPEDPLMPSATTQPAVGQGVSLHGPGPVVEKAKSSATQPAAGEKAK